ncbi:MAG: molybdopterin-dependent oxidoreductase [Deltaproteobacteria bacterium]|nr:molybdopterin-dependent oxidoreductase [Deltaproteobacteria bacterium]MBW2047237.1 molybdopterin-dependent oxidoreductase [Deltaproteobacteria bacterium]MBW2109951.1 molybdopterin-dependent oxidoreductase [Deltaproteobacteria bacterium]MBW2352307.1 molybdopterin-dependent oxidoreductase [Deltaproteobacteria bacterium]HDZ91926.1 molybdopterin oxidoreductase [Deltaproteobacteria bacterium]
MPKFVYSNTAKEMEAYGYDSVVKSHCRMCHGGCGVMVYVKDGKAVKIAGDPDCPINHGTLCSKGIASAQLAYHPDRLTHPVRRIGPKASGKWERISWDEALDTVAERILHYKEKFGAESIVPGYGTGRENEAVIYRFANLLGTPNVLTAGHFCYGPRIATSILTCGTNPIVDYENHPKCIMVWGNNLVISNPDCYKGEPFSVSLDKGAKLITVDPRLTRIAARSDIWLQLRPGTDTALALGMLNVIVNEELYDREFVENHVHGWKPFVERVNEYPLSKVEKITWVPKEKIRDAARLFSTTRPAAIQWGVAIEQQVNCADNNRALMALMGITGNIDVPGGQMLFSPPKVKNVGQFGAHKMLPREQAKKRLGGKRFRLAGNFAIINPKCVWDAILEEKPYPVKMLLLISSNPVMTRGNAKEVYRALEKVEFMVVSDFFLTPTAELADIVLPAATWLEMDYIGDFWKRHGHILPRRKVISVGECRSDHEMLNDLAHRVGQGEHWWNTFEGGLDYILEPMGITWQDFKKMDFIRGEVKYQKYREKGFSTPTGKFELYSTQLEKWGYDPLPQYHEAPESPVSTPELFKDYPYILITGRRLPGFFHTENRQVPWLRELHREPVVEIHPETAEKEGIKEGDWVVIESPRGRVRQRAKIFEGMDPRVVSAEHAWWFPEKKDPGHGWDESNINILTDNAYESCDPAMGATHVRTLLCKISPEKK